MTRRRLALLATSLLVIAAPAASAIERVSQKSGFSLALGVRLPNDGALRLGNFSVAAAGLVANSANLAFLRSHFIELTRIRLNLSPNEPNPALPNETAMAIRSESAPLVTVTPPPTPLPSATATPTPVPTITPTPSTTATPTITPFPSLTPTITPVPTITPIPTIIPPTPTISPTITATPTPTLSPTPSPTPTASALPTASATPAPSATPTPSITPTPSATPAPSGTPTPNPSATPTPGITGNTLVNLSTRGRAETGDNVLIGGFIISGDSPKTVVLRAIGPSLASAGVVDALADPSLQLVDSLGGVIDSNDNWMDNADEQAILDASLAPSDPSESAVIDTLDPGSYTAIVTGVDGTQNIALVEVFDLDSLGTSQLLNISTRGFVDLGDGVMIAGFIIGGTEAEDVVVRGLGPSLANPPAIVANPLADPVLELFDPNGLALAVNDNWQDTQAAAISAVGLAPTNVNEAAIFATLLPGSYTAMLFDANGTTGVGLVEVFNVTNSP